MFCCFEKAVFRVKGFLAFLILTGYEFRVNSAKFPQLLQGAWKGQSIYELR